MTRQVHDATGRTNRRAESTVTVAAAVLSAALFWFYLPVLEDMNRRWSHDPRYAHGYLVPVFALVVLWVRRDRLAAVPKRPGWGGLALIGIAVATRLAASFVYFGWLEGASLLIALAGLCVLVRGGASLRWSWPAIAYLVFMLPLPYRYEVALAGPLQRIATRCSTYALQTLGFPAVAMGNVIHLNDVELGVEEACSGLSMLFTFFALATGLAIVVRRPLLDKLVVVASAVPIALIANTTRITVTGVLLALVSSKAANLVFHDLAGWLMMPLALGLLGLELALLSRLLDDGDLNKNRLDPLEIAQLAKDLLDHKEPRPDPSRDPRRPSPVVKRSLKSS